MRLSRAALLKHIAEEAQKLPKLVQPPPKPIPLPDWPRWAKLVAVMKTDADKGVGDTLHRISSSAPQRLIGLAKELKKWWRGTKSCQCEADRRRYNQLYPYSMDASVS